MSAPPLDVPPAWRRRRLLLWVGIAALLAAVASRADFGSNLAALLPGSDPRLGRELLFFENQRAARLLAIEARVEDPALAGEARRVLDELASVLAPLGARPVDAGGPAAAARLGETVYRHLPVLLRPEQLGAARARMSGAPLRDWLRALKERASRPEELFAADAVRGDVLALAGLVLAGLTDQLPGGGIQGGVAAHPTLPCWLMVCEVDFDPNDALRGDRLMSACDAAALGAQARGVRLETIGSYRHFRDNYRGIASDLLATMPLGVLLIGLLLYSLVRSWRALVAVHVPALLAFAGAIAALHLSGRQAPMMMLGFGAGFLGIAVENAIHMTLALQAGRARQVRRPLIVSYLTTAVAFAVLAWSAVPALSCLGILVLGGLLTALAASLTLLPALVAPRPGPPPWVRTTAVLLRIAEGRPWPRFVVAGLLTLALAPGLAQLRFLDDLKRMDGSRPETWAALEDVLSRWGGFDASDFLVAEAPTVDAALARVAGVRTALGEAPSLVEALLPDAAEQQRRMAAWNALWSAEGAAFAAELKTACAEVGLGFRAFAPSLERYRPLDAAPLVGPDDWAGTPMADLLAGLVQPVAGGWRVASPLPDLNDPAHPDPARVLALERRVEALDGGAWLASRTLLARHLVDVVRADLAGRGLWMAAAMVLLVVLIERRARGVLAVIVPPTLALAWAFGLLGWLGQPLTPFSVIVGAFVAGIGLDGAVFLAQRDHRAEALAPVLGCTLTTILGVGSMALASNPLLANAGLALAVGMSACLFAALLLSSALAGAATRPVAGVE